MSIAPSCQADSILSGSAPPVTLVRWHLHRGTHRYYIVGPGATAMHPCSVPDYANRTPTIQPREAAIARHAIQSLNIHHREDRDAGPAEIKLALQQAAASTPLHIHAAPDLSDIGGDADSLPPPVSVPGSAAQVAAPQLATPDDLRRILAAVEFETGFPASQLTDSAIRTRNLGARALIRAQTLCFSACSTLFPAMQLQQIDSAFRAKPGTSSRRLQQHGAHKHDPDYARTLASLLAKLQP
jgi:hypothetical protein